VARGGSTRGSIFKLWRKGPKDKPDGDAAKDGKDKEKEKDKPDKERAKDKGKGKDKGKKEGQADAKGAAPSAGAPATSAGDKPMISAKDHMNVTQVCGTVGFAVKPGRPCCFTRRVCGSSQQMYQAFQAKREVSSAQLPGHRRNVCARQRGKGVE
jgi:hypothetical protein